MTGEFGIRIQDLLSTIIVHATLKAWYWHVGKTDIFNNSGHNDRRVWDSNPGPSLRAQQIEPRVLSRIALCVRQLDRYQTGHSEGEFWIRTQDLLSTIIRATAKA
jgi:hypothetical protein